MEEEFLKGFRRNPQEDPQGFLLEILELTQQFFVGFFFFQKWYLVFHQLYIQELFKEFLLRLIKQF